MTAVQHYDVQPASPLELWTTPPYEPAIRDGRVWARGATDNKGEFLPRVWAVEAWLEAIGPLPCRVRYLVEGQEETGSGALDALLDLRPDLREADAALIEGGGLDLRGRPWVDAGGKGIVVLDLSLRTMRVDSHSSVSVAPAERRPADGRGARDAVGRRGPAGRRGPRRRHRPADRRPARGRRRRSTCGRSTTCASTRASSGSSAGLDGIAAMEALTFEPTLNLQGLWAGHTDPGRRRP